MQKEDADGRLILSKKRARFEKAWKRIEDAHESGTPVEGTVIEVVKGGLILDLGVRGFLPASLVDIRRVQDLSEYVGQQLNCRVIEMNRNRNNVVLSRRAVLEEERKEVRQQIIDELNVGDVVEGTISNIVDFGAFVDLDGIDGLIHISELSWTHINHPSEVLQVNQKVKVKVLDIDRDRQRISLGLKQTQEDPWQKIVAQHKVGDIVDGRVTKIVAFGAFVEIYEGIEGLVHISELANRHVERPDEIVAVNQQVKVKIIEVDSERRRLSLSIKRVDGENVRPMRPAEPPEAEGAGPVGGRAGDADEPASDEDVTGRRGEEVAGPKPSRPTSPRPTRLPAAAADDEPRPRRSRARGRQSPRRSRRRRRQSLKTPPVPEHEPELGLSDEVFPQGAAPADEMESRTRRRTTAEATSRRRGRRDRRGLSDETETAAAPLRRRRRRIDTDMAGNETPTTGHHRRHRLRQIHSSRVPSGARRRGDLERRRRPPAAGGGRDRRRHP